MTNSERDAIAEGMLLHLKSYDPADAMLILTILSAKALWAATPNYMGALDKSVKIFMEGIIDALNVRMHGGLN